MLSTASAHQGSNIVLPDLPLAGDGSAPSDNITATNTSHVSAVWTELTTHSAPLSARPSSRSFHTLTAVTIFNERYLVLLGGRDESVVRDDHWIYHIGRQQWSRIEGVSDPLLLRRAYHTAVVREGNSAVRLAPTEIWLLGGKTVLSDSSDAFTSAITKVSFRKHRKSADDPFPFDVIVSAVEDVNGLGPRAYHSASVHNRCMVVFGGFNGSHFIDVLSVFHFDTRVWRHISPRPRRAPARNSLDKVLAASPSTVKSSAIGSPANPRASDATRREDPCEAPIDASNRSSVAASRMRSTSPLQSSSIAPPPPAAAECRECHAVDGCIHTSLLSALLPARQVYSATTAGLTSSIPPRDASMMVSGCGPAGRLVLFGGEVAYAFFSSVYSLDVHVGLNGSVTAEWYVASTGEEINRDGIAGNTSLSLSLTSRTSEGLEPAPKAYHCSWPIGGRSLAVLGGFAIREGVSRVYGDLHIFDTHRRLWHRAEQKGTDRGGTGGPIPAPRASAAVAAASIGNIAAPHKPLSSVYLFGGDDGVVYFNDLWRCDVYDDTPTNELSFRLRAACEIFFA
jgi:hypothetical protein